MLTNVVFLFSEERSKVQICFSKVPSGIEITSSQKHMQNKQNLRKTTPNSKAYEKQSKPQDNDAQFKSSYSNTKLEKGRITNRTETTSHFQKKNKKHISKFHHLFDTNVYLYTGANR